MIEVIGEVEEGGKQFALIKQSGASSDDALSKYLYRFGFRPVSTGRMTMLQIILERHRQSESVVVIHENENVLFPSRTMNGCDMAKPTYKDYHRVPKGGEWAKGTIFVVERGPVQNTPKKILARLRWLSAMIALEARRDFKRTFNIP